MIITDKKLNWNVRTHLRGPSEPVVVSRNSQVRNDLKSRSFSNNSDH